VLTPCLDGAVRDAWTKTLPHAGFAAGQSWEACGGDSVLALGLLLRLENALGRRLNFELITPEMTPPDLVRALQAGCNTPDKAMATVFLLPGMYGDDPMLADFRRSFEGRIHFETLDLPAPGCASALLTSVPAMAACAARDILRRSPDGPVVLAGYSLGAAVAYETAQLLRAGGRSVALLALLDAPFKAPNDFGHDTLAGMWGVLRHDPRGVVRVGAQVLRRSALGRRLMLRAFSRWRPSGHPRARRFVVSYLAMRALDCWRPAPAGEPVFACVSDALAATSVPRLQDLAPGSRVLVVPGGHMDLFRGPALERLVSEFQAAVFGAAGATGGRRET
jgi:thioesterase domain-containing protein